MSLLSEFKGNVVLSTDTGTSTKVNKIDANLATPASSTVMSIGSNIVGGTIKIGENIENPGTLLLGNAATGTTPQVTNIVQVQGRFQSNFLRTKTTNGALAIADDQSSGGTVSIGSTASTSITTNGVVIKQVVPLLGTGTVEVVTGDASNASSLSTTFNRKRTEPGAGGALNALDCYRITNATQTFTSQYFEIIISGSNLFYGGYSYKGCFSIYNPGSPPGTPTPSSVTTLYSANGIPTVTLFVSGTDTIVRVQTNLGGSTNQNFITTLIAYPTLVDSNTLTDYAITAI